MAGWGVGFNPDGLMPFLGRRAERGGAYGRLSIVSFVLHFRHSFVSFVSFVSIFCFKTKKKIRKFPKCGRNFFAGINYFASGWMDGWMGGWINHFLP